MPPSSTPSNAAQRYLDDLARTDVTARIDAVLSAEDSDESHRWAISAGRRVLGRAEW